MPLPKFQENKTASVFEACPLLEELYTAEASHVPIANGDSVPIGIHWEFAETLFKTVLDANPAVVLEVGLAHGFSRDVCCG